MSGPTETLLKGWIGFSSVLKKGGDLLAASLSGLPSLEDQGGSLSDCEGDPLKSSNNQPQTLSKQVADGDECERQNPPSLLEITLMAMGIHNWDRKKPISEEESRVARFPFDIKFKEADAATKHQFEMDFQKFQASQNATSATGASKTKNRHSFFKDSQSNRQLEPEVLIRSEKDQMRSLNSALAEKRNTPMKVICPFETCNFKSCVLECGNYENKEGICFESCHNGSIQEIEEGESSDEGAVNSSLAPKTGSAQLDPKEGSNCTKMDAEAEWTPNAVTTQTDNELDKGRGISKLSFIKPDIVDGKNAIKVGPDEFKENIKTSSLYLVGCFVGKRLAYPFVKETLTKLWDIGGDFEMTIQGLNMFFFKFSNPEDRQKVLEKGALHIASRVFLIREWRPFIEMETTNFTSIPVWVILRNIPHHMRSIEGMSRIASTLGVPMHLDKFTEEHISTTSFARVCIELHASCEYPSTIPIFYGDEGIAHIQCEYPWIPLRCTFCTLFGHNLESCDLAPKVQNTPKTVESKQQQAKSRPTSKTDAEGWTFPRAKQTSKKPPAHLNRFNVLEIRDDGDTEPVENVETGDKVTQVNQDDGNPDDHKAGFEETRSSTKEQTRSSSQKQQGLARKNENLLKNKGADKTLKSSQSEAGHLPSTNYKMAKVGFYYAGTHKLSKWSSYIKRRILWDQICKLSTNMNLPWTLLGDFNAIQSAREKVGGIPVIPHTIVEFMNCLQTAGLVDCKFKGNFLTWSNKSTRGKRVAVKLDRVLINSQWMNIFNYSQANFLNPNVSDHSPCILNITSPSSSNPKPFKFFNCWADDSEFLDVVKDAWNFQIEDHFKGNSLITQIRKLTFCAFISHIWGERNNRIFESISKSAPFTVQNIILDVRTKLACSKAVIEDTNENRICLQDRNLPNCPKTIEPIFCKWKKPHTGFHAINTDGSLFGGFGAMLRTEEGIAVKAVAGRVRAQSVIIHELQGIEAGLLLGLRMEIEKIILFTDSGEAYHLLYKEGKPPWRVKRIVERIKKLMLRFVSCLMEQVFREANAAADLLSKIKPMEGFIEMDPSEFSHELLVIVDEDAAGKPYMRL
ncbi:hypothetical protein GIB67_024782 [Kingdonia uniflora]|uniref:RNase H type-1 domain-containing protein n=1 Tax=Kingdonia uniflora TaxID=39325 RepID=A0A7J7N9V2_9MAGN|nr:hypothetical protein GIB67_024782 [Kingdonia uniflora]